MEVVPDTPPGRAEDLVVAAPDSEHRDLAGAQVLQRTLKTPPHARLAVETVLARAATEKQLPGRLRPWANDECRLFLLDRSRANRARWCSMAVCGNRENARRHYERTR